MAAESLAYVLTHECDVEPENARAFNQEVLICPIMPLEEVVQQYQESAPETALVSFLTNLGAKNISRLAFIPPIANELACGGVMYLNHITHAHINAFDRAAAREICCVTAYGLRHVEYVLENHLLRRKADRLAFDEERQDDDGEPRAAAA